MKFTIVDKSEDGLLQLIAQAEAFEQGNYIQAIREKRLNREEVMKLTDKVHEARRKMRNEFYAIAKFATTFNKQFATRNNGCFSSAEKLFKRLCSSLKGTRDMYGKFCRRRHPLEVKRASVALFERSLLSKRQAEEDLFGMVSYDSYVQELYDEMVAFNKELVIGLIMCRQVLRDESIIKNNPERCLQIFNQCSEEALAAQRNAFAFLSMANTKEVPQSEYEERLSKAKSIQDFAAEYFHNMELDEFNNMILCRIVKESKQNGLSDDETKLWPKKNSLALKTRKIIEHFDDLKPKGRANNLEAAKVAILMDWCGITGSGNEKFFVETYFPKVYPGAYNIPKANSVNTAKNKLDPTSPDYQNFVTAIEKLLTKLDGQPLKTA